MGWPCPRPPERAGWGRASGRPAGGPGSGEALGRASPRPQRPGDEVDERGLSLAASPRPLLEDLDHEAGELVSQALLGVEALGIGRACPPERVEVVADHEEVAT